MEVSGSDATQAVQVALNIRPLIASERMQGCKDCISVVPGEPQVQIGVHSFTFDHVYGSTGTPLSALFSDCVAPLVDGLFHGYNATVLAYGQTGSGKTFTMGTGYTVGGTTEAVIPQVMAAIFAKIESLKQNMEFLLRVSYIEILKEEIHDLLDSSQAASKLDPANGAGMFGAVLKMSGPVKPPIQIRETTNGGIVIAGITETVVNNVSEMASCLEQGSLCRATGSTNMNSSSSRSHAIFTVTVEQRRKWDLPAADSGPDLDEMHDDFLCAKLHLVDLAGSERAKRTGADGLRFKEGVHINKGLLALGNVISALGDDKKRKEGGHVPYRDSKLTRLLQDSLGGNSRTVMIACVSPADSNAEETLNTLKYANRARNIQNKPTVNRDPIAAEMQRMRQQMDLMQAELVCARAGGTSFEDVQMLKERIAWLESTNTELQQHLDALSGRTNALSQHGLDDQDTLHSKLSKPGDRTAHLKEGNGTEENMFARRIQKMDEDQVVASDANYSAADANLCLSKRHPDSLVLDSEEVSCPSSTEEEPGGDGEEYVEAKELEHTLLQDRLDKELQELNKHLEQKEAEMKTFAKSETLVLKHHFERKLVELEDEKKLLQKERDALVLELETLTTNSDEHTQKMQEIYQQKLKLLETQISDLRKRQENQSHLLRQKQRSDEAAKRLLDDIQRIKTQKVQLQHKIKQEAEQFRIWKACREKEVLQLRKEGRRTEYEMHKLQALNQRQKMVLQRKTEEAAIATRRLKELLEARKSSPRDTASNGGSVSSVFASQSNEKALQHWLEQELEVTVRVHEVRSAYEKQAESRVTFAKELRKLQEEEESSRNSPDSRQQTPNGATTGSSPLSMSPNARRARIGLLESIVNTSSTALVSMASQLSEAEERERTLSGRARWQHLRTLGDAKNLLQFIFNAAASSRCQLRDKEEEIGELKEKIVELQELLRKRDAQRLDIERQHRLKDQAVAAAVASATKVRESHPAVNKVKLNKASMAEEFPSVVVADLSGKSVVEQRSGAASQSRITDAKDRSAENFRDFTNVDCDASVGKSSFPYTLRKASRELQSSKIARCSENDGLEAESDMDISDGGVSDEEWEHRTTRSIVKKNRDGAEKTRLRKDGKVSQVNRKSRVARPRLQDLEASQGSECRSRPPAGESVFDENERKSHSGTERCCSCSPCSGCKTRKCECKAAGGLCGPNCGCKAGKCANRESVEMEADPTAVATAVQMEMAEAVETLRMDKERRRVIEQSGNSLGGNVKQEDPWVADASTRRAQQVLALHGANVLDYAWREGQHDEEGHVIQEAAGDNSVRRTPLCDIGNKKVKAQGRTLFKHRRRVQRGSLPAERHDLRYNTLTIDAIVAATGGLPTGAGKSICDNDEGRREDPSSKMEPDETRSRSGPLLACDNMIPTGSPSFVCHRIPAAVVDDNSLSTEQLKDIDKENQFI